MSYSNEIKVSFVNENELDVCDEIHFDSDCPLVYGSAAYIKFLLEALPRVTLRLLVAHRGTKPVGYLALVCQAAATKNLRVLNSLPFYGSHGGPIVRRSEPNKAAVIDSLLSQSIISATEMRAASVTLVENPLMPLDTELLEKHGYSVIDDRLGQFTPLPQFTTIEGTQQALMSRFHVKARNSIRKGQKLLQRIEQTMDVASLQWLQDTHERSIRALGGVPKSMEVFRTLVNKLPLGSRARLYVGLIDQRHVSGLLLLRHYDTVEYFTPAIAEEYRDQQALPPLILHAMTEATAEGAKLWNWGGTWRSQHGVYRFKSRLGAIDRPYRYFSRVLDHTLINSDPLVMKAEFDHFYTHRYT